VAGYMTDLDNGITNGYAWYSVYGGRQDYMTYFKHGRETTIELSSTKLPSSTTLPNFWTYNKKSWFNYLQNCLYGIHGFIKDSLNAPIKAKITVVGHDADSSEVYSTAQFGDFYRFLAAGTYTLKVTADNYAPKIISNVVVSNLQPTNLIVTLSSNVPVELTSFTSSVSNNVVKLNWATATETNNKGFSIERKFSDGDWKTLGFVKGNGTTTELCKYSFTDKVDFGKYSYRLRQVDFDGSFEYSKIINVEAFAPKVFSLEQNYPNPFNPSTVIKFNLATESQVIVKIFNIIGQEVKTLVNNRYSAGQHSVSFNAANLNSGVYFYKMEAKGNDGSNFSATKKMILTK
ncbi:MAG: T9SS type A sorting domain-containing protein, partial [Bacteroidota bacterium]|nr:T9SS type A sorting domain-containing protein [Bacteroidota bacterium]